MLKRAKHSLNLLALFLSSASIDLSWNIFSFKWKITNKKSHDHGLTRSSSTKHEATRNGDLSIIKKPVEHHYMKTTKCFNAKSQVQLILPSIICSTKNKFIIFHVILLQGCALKIYLGPHWSNLVH